MYYLIISILTTMYATLLNTPEGKQWIDENTATGVVIGTLIILTILRLMLPREHWRTVLRAFIAGGTPMVARSILNKSQSQTS